MTIDFGAMNRGFRLARTMALSLVVTLAALFVPSAFGQNASTAVDQKVQRLPPFALTESHGEIISNQDLRGGATIFGFIFTRCPGPCKTVTAQMARLRAELPADVRLACISVDASLSNEDQDTPKVFAQYAAMYNADPKTWWFLTGDREKVRGLIREGFLLSAEDVPNPLPGQERVTHSDRLVVVDGTGRVRGYFSSNDEESIAELKRLALKLSWYHKLPAVNATLNSISFALLVLGWLFVKRKNVTWHKTCMLSAFGISALFLICYLAYHAEIGSVPFPQKTGIWKTIYLAVLLPHIVLAAVMVIPILITLRRAFAGDFARHKQIARWTLPIWIYVSLTGVLVYVMLYLIEWPQS